MTPLIVWVTEKLQCPSCDSDVDVEALWCPECDQWLGGELLVEWEPAPGWELVTGGDRGDR